MRVCEGVGEWNKQTNNSNSASEANKPSLDDAVFRFNESERGHFVTAADVCNVRKFIDPPHTHPDSLHLLQKSAAFMDCDGGPCVPLLKLPGAAAVHASNTTDVHGKNTDLPLGELLLVYQSPYQIELTKVKRLERGLCGGGERERERE